MEGQLIASVAVAGPVYRLSRERMVEIGPVLLATVHDITKEIKMAALPRAYSAADVPVALGKRK
jgi:hypothetical protein